METFDITVIGSGPGRATHDFLLEEDLSFFKRAIPKDYLPNLEVSLLIENGKPIGFSSVSEGNLEMLVSQ